MCLVAFQKIFRKIFFGVWKRRRKTQIRKHKPQPRKKKSSTTKMVPVRRPCRRARDPRSRSMARSRSLLLREIAIDGAISRRRDRDRLSSLMVSFWVVACVFLDMCFPSSFPNTRKYFPENFLKCNQTQRNIFLFRKLAFPENMYFPENDLQQPNTALKFYFSKKLRL